ncbi:hypothetical protein ACIA8K_04595 [Catenuloplanes sp. NPDC051500]|uniref:nSTAND1 domain-containing NTPase n=1 Tax=Catenuloplanes sp. NPDC051500 TaxID=3363959 RepID=UPI0037AC6E2E
MTSPETDAAVAAIREMWQDRSAGERSAFTSALTPPPVVPTPSEDHITRVRVRAALSGAVDPAELGEPSVLEALSPEFDRSYVDGNWRWTLRSGPRRTVLRSLAGSPDRLAAGLADARSLPTDEAGLYLRSLAARTLPSAVLPGTAAALAEPSSRHADLLREPQASPSALPARLVLQALAWAEPLGGFAGDLAEARRRVRVEAVAASYGALLANGFFGRDEELARLRDFATVPVTPEDRPVPLLPVIGLGGAGKSTALAAFIEPYLRELGRPAATGPVVIVVDFDRVQFRIDAELELSFEVSRQLGNAHPVAAADFSALRYQAREERAGSAAARYAGSLAAGEGAGDAPAFERDASLLVRMHDLDNRAVLLILDTFEEWQRERPDPGRPRTGGNDPEARILRWIARLHDTMGLRGLRVILSGRADVAIDATEITGRVEVAEAVCLADLAPEAAAELLAAHGVPAEQAPALADLVGGSPLTLRVAARFFAHLSTDERATFIAGNAASVRDLDGDLRRELLYERFLGHIPDPRVRSLAHPGLVLRRVTAGLIRHVLAPHCGLGDLTDADATELLERLADEVWLVKRDGDTIRHLPDVRRAMLHLMTSDPAKADSLRLIHQAAADWYRSGRDLLGEAAAVEALYHDLMRDPDGIARLDARESRDRLIALGESVVDLPARTAVEVRVLRDELPPLAEVLTTRDQIWAKWVDHRGWVHVDGRAALEALSLLEKRDVRSEPSWLARAYCDLGRWGDYRPAADRYDDRRIPPHRYQAIAALLSGDEVTDAELPAVYGDSSGEAGHFSHILTHYYYRLLLRPPADLARWRGAEPQLVGFAAVLPSIHRNIFDLFPVDELRRTLVWVGAGCPGGSTVLTVVDAWGGRPLTRSLVAQDPTLLWALRGDNPELRAAARTALAEIGESAAGDADALAAIDLRGDLGRFLDESVDRHPDAVLLQRVRDAFHRWDRANNALIAAIVRDVEAGWPDS